MQSCQIVRKTNKKGGMGLSDFFSILAFALIIIIFYLFVKITFGSTTFELTTKSSNIENSLSLLGILRTRVIVDNKEMNIAELIAFSNLDATKKELMEKTLVQIIEDSFGTSHCSIFCVNEKKLKVGDCSIGNTYVCSDNAVTLPTYDGKTIEVSFESNAQSVEEKFNIQSAP